MGRNQTISLVKWVSPQGDTARWSGLYDPRRQQKTGPAGNRLLATLPLHEAVVFPSSFLAFSNYPHLPLFPSPYLPILPSYLSSPRSLYVSAEASRFRTISSLMSFPFLHPSGFSLSPSRFPVSPDSSRAPWQSGVPGSRPPESQAR